MHNLKAPETLELVDDAENKFKKWKQRCEIHLQATGRDTVSEEVNKVTILVHTIGEDALDICRYNTLKKFSTNIFTWSQKEEETIDSIMYKYLQNSRTSRNISKEINHRCMQ